jgi:predicted phosphodiesterase
MVSRVFAIAAFAAAALVSLDSLAQSAMMLSSPGAESWVPCKNPGAAEPPQPWIDVQDTGAVESALTVCVDWDVRPEDLVATDGSDAPLVVSWACDPAVYCFSFADPAQSAVLESPALAESAEVEFTSEFPQRVWVFAFFDRDRDMKCRQGDPFAIDAVDIAGPETTLHLRVHSVADYSVLHGLHSQPLVLPWTASAELRFQVPDEALGEVTWNDAETGQFLGSQLTGPSVVHRLELGGLSPDHRYTYSTRWDSAGTGIPSTFSPWTSGEFSTRPLGHEAAIRFAVIGDTMESYAIHSQLMGEMMEHSPDFLLHAGDIIGGDNGGVLADDAMQYKGVFEALAPMLRRGAFFPARGNHDADLNHHLQAFLLPVDRSHYAVDWGPARIVVLDDSNFTVDSEQLAWLDETLAESDTTDRFVVIDIHDAPMAGAGWQARYNSLVQILFRHRVNVVFGGHWHGYERNQQHPFTQVVTGGGGSVLQGPHWEVPNLVPMYHFCVVDVDQWLMTISVWKIGGELYDRFFIYGPGAPTATVAWRQYR